MKRRFLQGFWRIFRGYWVSEEKWKAWGLLGIVLTLNFVAVYILVRLNEWSNTFYNALQEYRYQDFWPLIGEFSALAFAHVAVAVYALYLRQMLQINWRRWLTKRYLEKWTSRQAYYRMQQTGKQTDNPDQRISEDINQFVALTLELSIGALKQLATLGAFVVILWNLSGVVTVPVGGYEFNVYGYMVWLSVAYAVMGTYLAAKIGNPLIDLNFGQQRYEADFRFRMIRLRENGESVAFYHGEHMEKTGLSACFSTVVQNYFSLMKYGKRLTWFTVSYAQFAIIFPFLLAAPRYFSGQLSLGGLMQTASAFGSVQEALSFFVAKYSDLAQWTAVIKRLDGFTAHMEQMEAQPSGIIMDGGKADEIRLRDLTVQLPQGEVLAEGLVMEIGAGEHVLISGASGAGKSTLMRAIAGLWPFGRGRITVPEKGKRLFLPQRPYLPLGSLREALLYPDGHSGVSDAEIEEALALCRLDKLKGSLAAREDWSKILSLGEQQRIAFARLLLIKPDWAFLDEATSALDEAAEKCMYGLLQERLPGTTVVSIGHRSTLREYHEVELHLSGGGTWRITKQRKMGGYGE